MLKAFTYFLAFMVIFLSVKPGIDAVQFSFGSIDSCCSIIGSEKSAAGDEQEDNGNCNPFLACGSCVLVVLSPQYFSVSPIAISTQAQFNYQSFKTSQFISDFWQPPQFV